MAVGDFFHILNCYVQIKFNPTAAALGELEKSAKVALNQAYDAVKKPKRRRRNSFSSFNRKKPTLHVSETYQNEHIDENNVWPIEENATEISNVAVESSSPVHGRNENDQTGESYVTVNAFEVSNVAVESSSPVSVTNENQHTGERSFFEILNDVVEAEESNSVSQPIKARRFSESVIPNRTPFFKRGRRPSISQKQNTSSAEYNHEMENGTISENVGDFQQQNPLPMLTNHSPKFRPTLSPISEAECENKENVPIEKYS